MGLVASSKFTRVFRAMVRLGSSTTHWNRLCTTQTPSSRARCRGARTVRVLVLAVGVAALVAVTAAVAPRLLGAGGGSHGSLVGPVPAATLAPIGNGTRVRST